MNGATLRFRLAGIPVVVQPAFWIVTVLLASDRFARPHLLAVWVLVVFASVLVHEMGHAVVFRRLGHRASIQLTMMGGQAQGEGLGLRPLGDILVSLAGPAAGLAVGLPLLLVTIILPGLLEVPVLGVLLGDLVWVNIGWGLINLLPVHPLDGGQAFHAILRRAGTPKATLRCHQVSVGVAVAVSLVAMLIGEHFVALGAAGLAVHNVLVVRRER